MLVPHLDLDDPQALANLSRFSLTGALALTTREGPQNPALSAIFKAVAARIDVPLSTEAEGSAWLDRGAAQVVVSEGFVRRASAKWPRGRSIMHLERASLEALQAAPRDVFGLRIALAHEALIEVDIAALVRAAAPARLVVRCDDATADDVARLVRARADVEVGAALVSRTLDFADALSAPLISDRTDGLFPTVVCDEHGVALGLAYSSRATLRHAIDQQVGAYHSRKRGLWVKGATSGATQKLLHVGLDCDSDALRFTVTQDEPGFCHEDTRTCWGEDHGIPKLMRVLLGRRKSAPEGSYTARLFNDDALLRSKLVEEANELLDAREPDEVAWETADVIYFALVAAARAGVSLAAIEAELDRRSLGVTRRPGNAKPQKT